MLYYLEWNSMWTLETPDAFIIETFFMSEIDVYIKLHGQTRRSMVPRQSGTPTMVTMIKTIFSQANALVVVLLVVTTWLYCW